MPPHTSSKFQPLDVGIFRPFKASYKKYARGVIDDAASENDQQSRVKRPRDPVQTMLEQLSSKQKELTQYEIPQIAEAAWDDATSVRTIKNSFRTAGIWHLNSRWPTENIAHLPSSGDFDAGRAADSNANRIARELKKLPSNQCLPELHGIKMSYRTLRDLFDPDAEEQGWLGDELIDAIARHVTHNSTEKVLVFDTQYVSWWTEWTLDEDCIRGPPDAGERFAKQLAEGNILWFPCHKAGNHWVCMFAFLKERRFEFFDSLGAAPGHLRLVCERIITSISGFAEFIDTSSWPCLQISSLNLQRDSWNCGIWVLGALEAVSEGIGSNRFVKTEHRAIQWLRPKYCVMLLMSALQSKTDEAQHAERHAGRVENSIDLTETGKNCNKGDTVEIDQLGVIEPRSRDNDRASRDICAEISHEPKLPKEANNNASILELVGKLQCRLEANLDAKMRWAGFSPSIVKNNHGIVNLNVSISPEALRIMKATNKGDGDILDVLFRQVGGSTFIPPVDSRAAKRRNAGGPMALNSTKRLKLIRIRDQKRAAKSQAEAQKKRERIANEGDVELLLIKLAVKSPESFSYERGERMTKDLLLNYLIARGLKVSKTLSRSDLLNRIRELNTSFPEVQMSTPTSVGPEQSSTREEERALPANAPAAASPSNSLVGLDELRPEPTAHKASGPGLRGVPVAQNRSLSANDEAVVVKAMLAKAASCNDFAFSCSRSKARREDLLEYIRTEGLRVPWQKPRADLMQAVLGHIRSNSSASTPPPNHT